MTMGRALIVAALIAAPVSLILTYLLFSSVGRVYVRRARGRMRPVQALVRAGDTEAARAATEAWERGTRPRDALDRLNIAKTWSMIGDHERTLATLSATTVPKGRMGRPFRRSVDEMKYGALVAGGKEAEAGWFLNEVVDRDPKAPWLFSARIRSARRAGDRAHERAAMDLARRAAASDPKNLRAAHEVLKDAIARHRFDEAAQMLERFTVRLRRLERKALGPTASDACQLFISLGTVRLAAGDAVGAEEAFARALGRATDAQAVATQIERARADGLFYARRFDDAAAAYETIVRGREDHGTMLALGECRRRLGDLDAARAALQRATRLGCDASAAKLLEARLLADDGAGPEAERAALEGAGGAETTDFSALYTLTYVRVLHHLAGAEETLRRYVALLPEDPDLDPLLAGSAPDGRTWRQLLEVAPRPDVSPGG